MSSAHLYHYNQQGNLVRNASAPPAHPTPWGVTPGTIKRGSTPQLGATSGAPSNGAPQGGMMAGAPQGGTPNVMQQSAGAYNNALGVTNAATNYAMNMPTAQASAQGYQAFTGGPGFGGSSASGAAAQGYGYDAQAMQRARDVAAGQFAGTDIAPYMNPYTSNVINQAQADMERARLMQQNQADDAMQAAGAFGGSRHGIANAETNRNYYDRLGAMTGGLRNQGYQNAQAAAFQDIANRMQADLANQGADLTTNQYNAEAVNRARMTGANNKTRASVATAGNRTNASIANAANSNAMARAQMAAMNDAARFGAAAQNQANLFNAGQLNTANQNRFGNMMQGAGAMSGLAGQGFGMAMDINQQRLQENALIQGMQQAQIDASKDMFNSYINSGQGGLPELASFLGGNYGGTTSQSSNPGLLGFAGSLVNGIFGE